MRRTVLLGIAALAHQFGNAAIVDDAAALQDGNGLELQVLATESIDLQSLFVLTAAEEVYYEVR